MIDVIQVTRQLIFIMVVKLIFICLIFQKDKIKFFFRNHRWSLQTFIFINDYSTKQQRTNGT
ncbi:hypothetical protein PGS1_05685 [Enterobacter cloacae subsp. cloacae GS1]|nr:hypothetical protein PGS1_05685 [Enterobacter cloacae subsp. cloacae GS1]